MDGIDDENMLVWPGCILGVLGDEKEENSSKVSHLWTKEKKAKRDLLISLDSTKCK